MNRIVGLDYLRIYSVLIVFLFHSWMHLGCTFSKFTTFISEGAVYMTLFFMMSGYVLGIKYKNQSIDPPSLIKFYRKRFATIFPLYIICAFLYPPLFGNETFTENAMLLPIEMLGLQSFYPSLSTITHNGGTWFVSCIIVCYILAPLLISFLNGITRKASGYLYMFLCVFLLTSSWVIYVFEGNELYTNPLNRFCEFTLGMILALHAEGIVKKFRWITSRYSILASYLLVLMVVMLLLKAHVPHVSYMAFSAVLVPCFSWQLLSHTTKTQLMNCKALRYCADISYAFFLMQLFVFKFTVAIMQYWDIESKVYAFTIAILLCFSLSALGHRFIEQPIAARLKR